ncbi:MAG: hypothetical protein JNJ77_16160 [Planctomycetia bacterium]|nr:hypothetical protein [Planctomycetia bacterium]
MPQIDWIEIGTGSYPMIRGGKKKIKLPATITSIIFIVTKGSTATYEYYLRYTDADMAALASHMANGDDVTFVTDSLTKTRRIKNKQLTGTTKNVTFKHVTSYA